MRSQPQRGSSAPLACFADLLAVSPMSSIRTITRAIILMMVGTGLFIVGKWLLFGGMLGKDTLAVAALLAASGFVIAFVREFWIKRW